MPSITVEHHNNYNDLFSVYVASTCTRISAVKITSQGSVSPFVANLHHRSDSFHTNSPLIFSTSVDISGADGTACEGFGYVWHTITPEHRLACLRAWEEKKYFHYADLLLTKCIQLTARGIRGVGSRPLFLKINWTHMNPMVEV